MFLFGGAEQDRAFALSTILASVVAVGVVIAMKYMLKGLIWLYNVWMEARQAKKAGKVWK